MSHSCTVRTMKFKVPCVIELALAVKDRGLRCG